MINIPLSKRIMPKRLEHYFGQKHLIGNEKPISTMITNNTLHSMILYGPPACGKTTLARLIANKLDMDFIKTNAIYINAEEIKGIIAKVNSNNLMNSNKTLLFIDEVHRLNKPKQDAFLEILEDGKLVLIGATTENPFFIMQPALRSRVFIYKLEELDIQDNINIINDALSRDENLNQLNIKISDKTKKKLINLTKDPRKMLDTLEMIILTKNNNKIIEIFEHDIYQFLQIKENNYSATDGHYNIISAFIKSIRGSDPDASLYYLARMLEGGEDPLFIFRRLLIICSEDIGLAEPMSIVVANNCFQAFQQIGMPEGRIIIGFLTVYLALLPKSNSTYLATDKALNDIKNGNIMKVPEYLKGGGSNYLESIIENKNTNDLKYKYPHDFPNNFIPQKYTEKIIKYFSFQQNGVESRLKKWKDYLINKFK